MTVDEKKLFHCFSICRDNENAILLEKEKIIRQRRI